HDGWIRHHREGAPVSFAARAGRGLPAVSRRLAAVRAAQEHCGSAQALHRVQTMMRVVERVVLTVTAARASAVALGAGFDDLHKRKPGLWEMSTTSTQNKGAPALSRVCIDAATDTELMNFGLGVTNQLCSKRDIRLTGSVATIDMVCTIGNSQATTHS